jgi:hypothetical protein
VLLCPLGVQPYRPPIILLSVLRDKARTSASGTLADEIEQTLLKNPFKQGHDAFKLLPTQGDRESFLSLVKSEIASSDDQIVRA